MHAIFFNEPIESNFLGHQMAEIYKDNVYVPYLSGKKNLVILDVGSNIGLTSYYFSQFAETVYSIEPSLEHFDVLTRMIKFNHLKNVVPIRKAIYIRSGKYPLFHNKNTTMFSLHMAVDDKSSKEELVDCVTIEDFLKENKIKKVDFMKLDIEGSETEVLSHTSFKKVAKRIETIVVERHKWSQRHPNQLVDALKMTGYEVNPIPNTADLLVAKR